MPSVETASHTSTVKDETRPNQVVDPAAFGDEPGRDEKDDPYLVRFVDGDPINPKNWSRLKRWYLTMVGGLLVLNSTFASSAPSGIIPELMEHFTFSSEVGTLTISVFVAGYCVGPLIWGPLSEQYGRRPIFIIVFLLFTIFQVACAVSTNTAEILIFRLLGGVFASAPLSNSGALIADIWDVETRGKALAIFTLAPFAGPALGPTVAGYISVAGLSWRWVFWVMTIFAGVCWLQIVFTLPETYAPILLIQKAKRMRKETGDEGYYAQVERIDRGTVGQRVNAVLTKPFKILFFEPMLIAVTVYMSFVYGCLYLLFEAYPIVFTKAHHFNAGASGLMFLPLPVGGIGAVLSYVFYFNPRYERAMKKYAPNPVPPEIRLEMALFAGPGLTISFFWFAWTSYPSISFWAPMMAGLTLGWSICYIFLSLFNYIIDTYLFAAASALSANTVCRSMAGAAFPLFATQMYDALGPRWASSLLGFIALIMTPIPYALVKYGPALRLRSKYAPSNPVPPPQNEKQVTESAISQA